MFSKSEDPENITFDLSTSLIPKNSNLVVDAGTGTARFAVFLANKREDIEVIKLDFITYKMKNLVLISI